MDYNGAEGAEEWPRSAARTRIQVTRAERMDVPTEKSQGGIHSWGGPGKLSFSRPTYKYTPIEVVKYLFNALCRTKRVRGILPQPTPGTNPKRCSRFAGKFTARRNFFGLFSAIRRHRCTCCLLPPGTVRGSSPIERGVQADLAGLPYNRGRFQPPDTTARVLFPSQTCLKKT